MDPCYSSLIARYGKRLRRSLRCPLGRFGDKSTGDVSKGRTRDDTSYSCNGGMRLGLGYNIPYDQWDLNLTWTHFHNTTDSSLDAPPNGYLLGIYTSASVWPVDASLNYDAKWKLQYDTLDLELGRSFFTSKALSLRPFVSARGARIDQDMDLLYSGVDPDLILGHAPFATYL